MIWNIFLAKKKKNFLAGALVILFNSLAAILEGVSFVMLLASFSLLTCEMFSHPIASYFQDSSFKMCLLFAICMQILRSLSIYLGQLFTTFLTLNVQQESQKKIFHHIFWMPFSEIAQYKKGKLLHLANAPPSYIPLLFDEYNRFVVCFLMVIAYLVLMFHTSWQLTSMNLLLLVLAASLQRFFFTKIELASLTHNDQVAQLSQQTAQNLEGIKHVHIFHRQKQTMEGIEILLKKISHATLGVKKWNALIPCLNESIGIIFVGISLIAGSLYLQAAPLFIYITLTYRLTTRLQQMMVAKGIMASHQGELKRLQDILSKPLQLFPLGEKPTPPFQDRICFHNISFKYPQREQHALKNIDLQIPKNHIVALVGISGSGKSSIIDLLLQLYPPSHGEISFDGMPIHHFNLESWRQLFGVVPQDSFLFHETIEQNIRHGREKASFEEILEAAKKAGADAFIKKLPRGYQTIVGERGYRLSGGERQRISLAQALVKNPEILILDEATSHLDSHSETSIQETLARLHHQKTMLIVAHRLSTIQMADLIYVLENGRIIEKGTHSDLMSLSGRYQIFWNLQSLKARA